MNKFLHYSAAVILAGSWFTFGFYSYGFFNTMFSAGIACLCVGALLLYTGGLD